MKNRCGGKGFKQYRKNERSTPYESIAYLIDYLSADLREKPSGSQKKTQADHLPTFMKTAKNRERIVKLLKKLQEK
ncbi:hypothetical protein [Pseudoflavonifractor capillosus]|uniref:hypothetical protein n=1 Tax=Pseudoflavonifractor capillosus TaxID=106588 RepID=UPI0002EB1F78|nr:hypothetical protein [Pseudoflavonifractor capillosus]